MRWHIALIVLFLLPVFGCGESQMQQLTPILVVDKIEPSLPFWEDGLGFERVAEVPGDDGLNFVMLQKNSIVVMYQTQASIDDDMPQFSGELRGSKSVLYINVADVKDIPRQLEGFDLVMEPRTTFYGADEIGYREPAGHFVIFAQQGDSS